MKTNNVTFTSKINFVQEGIFKQKSSGTYIDISWSNDIIKKVTNTNIWTDGVRTCTAGGAVNTKTGEAAAFHFYDCRKYFNKCEQLVSNVLDLVPGADRVMVLGGKELPLRKYSKLSFLKFRDTFSKYIKNVTSFGIHTYPNSESNILYSASADEWFINTLFGKNSHWYYKNVDSVEDILENFKHISIAEGDNIFIGNKPVKFPNNIPLNNKNSSQP